jgi:hypothetical protein
MQLIFFIPFLIKASLSAAANGTGSTISDSSRNVFSGETEGPSRSISVDNVYEPFSTRHPHYPYSLNDLFLDLPSVDSVLDHSYNPRSEHDSENEALPDNDEDTIEIIRSKDENTIEIIGSKDENEYGTVDGKECEISHNIANKELDSKENDYSANATEKVVKPGRQRRRLIRSDSASASASTLSASASASTSSASASASTPTPTSKPMAVHDAWFTVSKDSKKKDPGIMQKIKFTANPELELRFSTGVVGPLNYVRNNPITVSAYRPHYGVMINAKSFAVALGFAQKNKISPWALGDFTTLPGIKGEIKNQVKTILRTTKTGTELLGLVGVIQDKSLRIWSAGNVPFAVYRKRGNDLEELEGGAEDSVSTPIQKGDMIVVVPTLLSKDEVQESTTSSAPKEIGTALMRKLKSRYPRADIVVVKID